MTYDDSNPVQRAALTAELTNDPRAYGYAPDVAAGSIAFLVTKLNLPRPVGSVGHPVTGITVRRGIRTGIDVMNCIELTAFEALTVGRQQYIIALVTPVEGVDLSDDTIRANLLACFPASPTRTALIAAADRIGSRAEELFGTGADITSTDVAHALGRF